jgi:uncharacterized protein YcfL
MKLQQSAAMKLPFLIASTIVAATMLVGCRPAAQAVGGATRTVVSGHEGGAYSPRNTTKFDLENEAKFVTMDNLVQRSVTCSGLQEKVLADGRLEVAANVRNRLERRIQVQIQCVFKDAQGFSTGDESPWQDLILTETAQETVRFQSFNDKAKGYTIRVREAR